MTMAQQGELLQPFCGALISRSTPVACMPTHMAPEAMQSSTSRPPTACTASATALVMFVAPEATDRAARLVKIAEDFDAKQDELVTVDLSPLDVSRDEIKDRLFNQELTLVAERYLRDLKREATIVRR